MGIRGTALAASTLALALAPAAAASSWTVRYETHDALRGLHVVHVVPALHVAEVTARAQPRRHGIVWAQATTRRRQTSEPALAPSAGTTAAPEWQYAATREDLVPAWVLRAASTVTVAVVDTGADLDAPDLAAKSPVTYDVGSGGADVRDSIGHGTFVSSLAAGSATNGDGIAGFGGDARLMVVRANRGGSTFSDVDEAAAVIWAVDHGARVVNLSIGGPQTSRVEREAVDYATSHGALLVAAAGNDGAYRNIASYPAALLGRHGLAVGASTTAGRRAPFSTAASYLSVAAPGVDVLGAVSSTSSSASYPRTALAGASGLYGFGSGTSYSAPEVAGAAALVWAANPLLSADQVVQTIEQTATGNGAFTRDLGYGVIDVAAAVASATGADVPPAAEKAEPAPTPARSRAKPKPLRTRR